MARAQRPVRRWRVCDDQQERRRSDRLREYLMFSVGHLKTAVLTHTIFAVQHPVLQPEPLRRLCRSHHHCRRAVHGLGPARDPEERVRPQQARDRQAWRCCRCHERLHRPRDAGDVRQPSGRCGLEGWYHGVPVPEWERRLDPRGQGDCVPVSSSL